MRVSAAVLVASLLVAAAVVATRDPEEPLALVALIVALAAAVGSVAAMPLLRRERGRRARRRGVAVRRAVEVAAIAGLLLLLRAVDGLSPITAAFVIAAIAGAEAALVARPRASSR